MASNEYDDENDEDDEDTKPEVALMQYGDEKDIKSRLHQYFLENHKSSLRIRSFNFVIKLLTCILYCFQVIMNNGKLPDSDIDRPFANSPPLLSQLFWTNRTETIWIVQITVATISMICTVVIFYITYKGNLIRILTHSYFLVELLTGAPLIVSFFVPTLRDINLPIFFNCWIANGVLQDMLHDFHRISLVVRHSVLSREIVALFSILICLIFTGTCAMETLQRAGEQRFDLFTSFYFVVATFSTVGYGDVTPDRWLSRLCVIVLIIFGICMLPKKIESLTQAITEREKAEFNNTNGFTQGKKHIVVTIPQLEPSFVHDFLTEFYAHRKHQAYMVVLLSPCDLDIAMRTLLRIPRWSDRVSFVRGTALKDEDLDRVNMIKASGCFILSARNVQQKKESDQKTILRSWAVKDYAPDVPQYVQVFLAETKMHVEHAELVICEDEFKYSLLANNCICPEEGQRSSEAWHRTYGFHSGNEIYDIVVKESRFFGEYVGKTFTFASFHAHRYGICLVGVRRDDRRSKIQLNPGHLHVVQSTDRFYYIALTNEESLSEFRKMKQKTNMASTIANIGNIAFDQPQEIVVEEEKSKKRRYLVHKARTLPNRDAERPLKTARPHTERKNSIADVTGDLAFSSSDEETACHICSGPTCIADQVIKKHPPYFFDNTTICHILKDKKPICCLHLTEPCQHSTCKTAHQYKFRNRPIIVAVDKTNAGLYNLLLPLRSFHRPIHDLQPIILLLQLEDETQPNDIFLEFISHFPDIYWLRGKISSLDNLLKAGVNLANHVIVVKEASVGNEVQLLDCDTIITAQRIYKMFPNLKITTELIAESNMRFMEFDANDQFALQQSKIEKKERQRGSSLSFMFRLPFANGSVFSAHMLDRLLYQSFLKPYLCQFLKILLGIDATEGSGYLTSLEITENDVWIRTYGRLYQKLCSSVADIPIGIYRTISSPRHPAATQVENVNGEENPIGESRERRLRFQRKTAGHVHEMVKQRMQTFHLSIQKYDESLDERKRNISYVIINPSFDLELQPGDIIYVLRAPLTRTAKHKRIDPRAGIRRRSEIKYSTSSDQPNDPRGSVS